MELLSELKKANLFNEILTVQTAPPGNVPPTLRLTGTITKFNPGSQEKRHLIGLGAGTTRIDARVRFLDRKTCAVVLEADVDGKVVGGWLGGDSFGAARGVAKEVVQHARRMRREVLSDAPVTCAADNATPMTAVASIPGAAAAEGASEQPHEPDLEQRLLARYKSLSSDQIAELETNAAAGTRPRRSFCWDPRSSKECVAHSDREAYRWYLTSAAAGYKSCEANLKNAGKGLNRQEREAAERDAREWAKRFSR